MKKLEICCGSFNDVKIASQFDIDSIELNSALSLGGLTPSISTLQQCKRITNIPLYCMVRNVEGGFIYSQEEFETMINDAKLLLENGADGIVFGCLNENLTINIEQTQELIELAHSFNKQAIFHRAFDLIDDQLSAYQTLIEMRIDRVLTSGGHSKALDGLTIIRELLKINPNHIIVGSGINPQNVQEFYDIPYLHASCKELKFRKNGNHKVNYDIDQPNTIWGVSEKCVETMVNKLKK